MRLCLRVWVATALWMVMFSTGTAHADVPRTADGNAVMAGSGDAPVQLEIFCEPQCPHCAELESTSGDRIAGDLASGRLAVTYRWLTFLDDKHHNDVSARVTNSLFLAADPSTSPTAYQAFVQDLYRHQSQDGPNNNDIAAMARESGIPEVVADRIAAGEYAVDTAALNDANRARLAQVNPANPGTPTVYDLKANRLVDIQDPGWLDDLSS
ncbi:MAG: thioredoxin domain-containing protein [Mycobacterium sp.]|uniref:DsbA family protein n=1 Tax=Mycobacterium sp. TaxID=1785 RepID=UPI003BB0776F